MPPSTVSRHRGPALALLASMAACEATTVARVDADEAPEVGVPEASAPVWPEPPLIAPKPPISPGILNCAPIFIDPDGICRPRIEACTTDELAIPSRGCVTPVRVAAEVPPGAAVFEVFSDDEVAAGLGPGLAEVIATAPAGSVLQLREGRFRGDVVIDKALIVQGRGVGLTVVEGGGDVVYAISVVGAAVAVSDLTIHGAANGIGGFEGAELRLDRVFLLGTVTVSLYHSDLVMMDSRVLVATVHAILAENAKVTLDGVALPGPPEKRCTYAVSVDNPPASFDDVIINGAEATCWAGTGELRVRNSHVDNFIAPRSPVTLKHVLTQGLVYLRDTGDVHVSGSRIEGRLDMVTPVVLQDSVVIGIATPDAVAPGVLSIAPGSRFERVELTGGAGDAISVKDDATGTREVLLRDVVIRNTEPGATRPGVGIRVGGLKALTLERVVIENVANIGILATTLASVRATHLHIDGGPADDAHPYRFGIVANTGATLLLRDSVITRSIGLGVWLKDGTSTLDADGLWIDGVVPGLIEDVDQGTIEGVADGLLVTVGATATVKRLAVRDIDRVSLHSAAGHGSLSTGHFTRCDLGFVTTGSVEEWTLEGLENECDTPTYSDSVLVVPRRVRL